MKKIIVISFVFIFVQTIACLAIETYVDRFIRIDLGELSDQERPLIEMVQRGEFDKAIEGYKKLDALKQFEQESDDIKQISAAQEKLEATKAQKTESRDSLYAVLLRQVDALKGQGGESNLYNGLKAKGLVA